VRHPSDAHPQGLPGPQRQSGARAERSLVDDGTRRSRAPDPKPAAAFTGARENHQRCGGRRQMESTAWARRGNWRRCDGGRSGYRRRHVARLAGTEPTGRCGEYGCRDNRDADENTQPRQPREPFTTRLPGRRIDRWHRTVVHELTTHRASTVTFGGCGEDHADPRPGRAPPVARWVRWATAAATRPFADAPLSHWDRVSTESRCS
jgi:hypothetical protein